jgi:hypothetical protein
VLGRNQQTPRTSTRSRMRVSVIAGTNEMRKVIVARIGNASRCSRREVTAERGWANEAKVIPEMIRVRQALPKVEN